MSRLRGRLTHSEDEAGFTLVELLVAMAVSSMLLVAVTGTVINALQTQRRHTAQADAVLGVQRAFDRMTRDIRQAHPVTTATPTAIQVEYETAGIRHVRRYAVVGTELRATRTEVVVASGATTSSTSTLLRGLAPGLQPFAYLTGDPVPVPTVDVTAIRRVDITVRLGPPARIEQSTAVVLRNARSTP